MPAAIVAPSILSADFAQLGRDCQGALEAGADWLHVDVMDGHFVPNISLGFPVIKGLSEYMRRLIPLQDRKMLMDVHIMVSHPLKWIQDLKKSGADQVCFHIETVDEKEFFECVQTIKNAGMRAAVAFKPKTAVEEYLPMLMKASLDMVLVMTVEPGFGGQTLMAECLDKVSKLRAFFPVMDIQVDGGLNEQTARLSAIKGANVIVAGTSVFGASDWKQAINNIRSATNDGLMNHS